MCVISIVFSEERRLGELNCRLMKVYEGKRTPNPWPCSDCMWYALAKKTWDFFLLNFEFLVRDGLSSRPQRERWADNKTKLTKPLPRQPKAARRGRGQTGRSLPLCACSENRSPVRRVNNSWPSGLSRVLVRTCERLRYRLQLVRARVRPCLHAA